MKKKIDFNMLNQALESAPMSEKTEIKIANNDARKKLISIPVEWENSIKANFKGTVSSYIKIAIFERLQKDGML